MVLGDRDATAGGDSVGRPTGDDRFVRWFLLDGNRWVVALLVSALILASFAGLGTVGIIGVTEKALVSSMLSPSITGIFTLVTITTSINQLVLSRIIGSPEDLASRTQDVRDFRSTVEDLNPRRDVSPTEPATFLRELGDVIENRTKRLARAFQRESNTSTGAIDDLTSGVMEATHGTVEALDADDLDLYDTLSPILNDEYSKHLHTIRRVEANRTGLDDGQVEALEDLKSALIQMNYTRHYFKTLYLHEALADVSLYLFLTGVPSLVVGYLTILSYDSGPVLSGISLLLVVSVAMTVVLFPLTILFAYILRIVTIAKRTTTFGTFTPPDEMP